MTRALLIVDVQNDFTEGGALGVDGGSAVAQGVTALLQRSAGEYSHIFASRDWHSGQNDNGGHFATEPDYVNTWPVHCVAETPGAEYHPDLETKHITHHVRKGYGEPAYSAFEGMLKDGQRLSEIVATDGVQALDIVGIATDHCVRASARDALAIDLSVRIYANLIAGVNEHASARALAELQALGVEVSHATLSH